MVASLLEELIHDHVARLGRVLQQRTHDLDVLLRGRARARVRLRVRLRLRLRLRLGVRLGVRLRLGLGVRLRGWASV